MHIFRIHRKIKSRPLTNYFKACGTYFYFWHANKTFISRENAVRITRICIYVALQEVIILHSFLSVLLTFIDLCISLFSNKPKFRKRFLTFSDLEGNTQNHNNYQVLIIAYDASIHSSLLRNRSLLCIILHIINIEFKRIFFFD